MFIAESGQPVCGGWVTRRFQTMLAKAELPRQRFHDLRHACASLDMLAQGVPLRVAMEALGHSQIHVIADTHGHVMLDLQGDATERVGAALWGAS